MAAGQAPLYVKQESESFTPWARTLETACGRYIYFLTGILQTNQLNRKMLAIKYEA